jgi:hypothetical protein
MGEQNIKPPAKIGKTSSRRIEIDELDFCAMTQTIFNFYEERTHVPTSKELQGALRSDISRKRRVF